MSRTLIKIKQDWIPEIAKDIIGIEHETDGLLKENIWSLKKD